MTEQAISGNDYVIFLRSFVPDKLVAVGALEQCRLYQQVVSVRDTLRVAAPAVLLGQVQVRSKRVVGKRADVKGR